MKIGLVGEAPHDTNSIKNLLERQEWFAGFKFQTLLNNIHGSKLDSQQTKRQLRIEYETEKPDVVLFIRDLDSQADDKSAVRLRKEYFSSFNSVVNKSGIFLLNIFEIEALIISDIETFNQHFKCEVVYNADPMTLKMPKEYLRSRCKDYLETDNPEIFKKLVFETLLQNCTYFREFITKLQVNLAKH